MKIACNVTGGTNRSDQWVTCRCEGRAAINAGFGFAQLGHEVDIVAQSFEDKVNVSPGVTLRQKWDRDAEYDLIFVWNPNKGSFPFDNYKKAIYMIEPSTPVEVLKQKIKDFPKAKFCTASQKAIPLVKQIHGLDVTYFPILYPIPCLPGIKKQDFLDFNFDKDKKDINVWVFISSWPSYHILCDEEVLESLRVLRDKHGYKMNVTVHRHMVGNPDVESKSQSIISEFNATAVESNNLCYLDVLNNLSNSDICITKGGASYAGNCAFDILSLGKLMIYTTEGCNANCINDIYPLDEFVLRHEDTKEGRAAKIDRIISDPLACYTAMKNQIITYSFPLWSEMVTEIIDRLNIT